MQDKAIICLFEKWHFEWLISIQKATVEMVDNV